MHSIELLLDSRADDGVRADWTRLAEAGLPSQARHSGASNAPHVTLLAATTLDASHDDELAEAFDELPVPVRFGGLVVFGAPPRGFVLARGIVVSDVILRVHRSVYEISADERQAPQTRPGEWTPHVTLASRLSTEELASAFELLAAGAMAGEAEFASARRWDSTARETVLLGPRR